MAAHLLREDTNESVAVVELRHVAAEDLHGALRDMEDIALGTKATRGLYHASINVGRDEPLTPDQWKTAADRLEAALGLDGHARARVMHEKAERPHMHVVWSRIDTDTMTAVHDGHNYRTHELVARELEREFGLQRVQGAHVEREGVERPDRTPSPSEMQQAARTGHSVAEVKAEVTALWHSSDNAEAFVASLDDSGFRLAQGDRRDFVLVDDAGGVHSLARRIEGVKAAEVRERLAGIDRDALPTVREAQEAITARAPETIERGADPAPETGTAAERTTRESAPALPSEAAPEILPAEGGSSRPTETIKAEDLEFALDTSMKLAGGTVSLISQVAEKIVDVVDRFFEGLFSLFAGPPSTPRTHEHAPPPPAREPPTEPEPELVRVMHKPANERTPAEHLLEMVRQQREERGLEPPTPIRQLQEDYSRTRSPHSLEP